MKDVSPESGNLSISILDVPKIGQKSEASISYSISIALIIIFFLSITIASFNKLGPVLIYAVPILSTIIAIYLYFRAPPLYVAFVFWCWILIPLVRRISDYYTVFTNPNPMLLAPYLVSLVSIITLFRYVPQSIKYKGLPFIIAFFGVFYGVLVGFINRKPYVVLRESMDWIIPITMGYHFLVHWQQYPSYRRVIQRTFMWGVLFMGIYGVSQFLALSDWDRLWVIESDMVTATGSPDDSGGTRVWSTMQSGEPFAAFMAAALLVLMTSQSYFALPASIPGYISFLLSLVRSGWLGWLGGFLLLASSLKVKFQIRLILLFGTLLLFILPISTSEFFGTKITSRIETLSNMKEDSSASGRQEMFQDSIGAALSSVTGEGIGGGTRDNVILATLFDLGWIGAIPYISALSYLVHQVFTRKGNSDDVFIPTCQAVVVTALIRLPVNGSLLGLSGILLWGFLGLALAGDKYQKFLKEQSFSYSQNFDVD